MSEHNHVVLWTGNPAGNAGELKKWSNGTWSDLVTDLNGNVEAVSLRKGEIYVGGTFTTIGGLTTRALAKRALSGGSWSRFYGVDGEPWIVGTRVKSIGFNGSNQMYVTGFLAGEQIYLWTNNGWSDDTPAGTGPDASCYVLAVDWYKGNVYVGGTFTTVSGITANRIAAWNDQQKFTVVDLGTLSANTYASGQTVNNNWKAAGYSQALEGGSYKDHGFTGSDGYLTDLQTYYGSGPWDTTDQTYVYGINDSDIMVGTADQYGSGTYFRGFRNGLGWWTLLEPFYASSSRSEALSVNNNADAVGFSVNSLGYYRATLWPSSQTTGMDLKALVNPDDPTKHSYAYGINRNGNAVGKAQISGSTAFHAFRTGKLVAVVPSTDDLGTMGGTESVAYAINDGREIVGSSQNNSQAWRAFVKDPDSASGQGFTDIAPGNAYAINNRSQIVGSSGGAAFVWQRGLGTQNLSGYLPAGSQWTLASAEAVNDEGAIVGWGYNCAVSCYYFHAFMLKP